MKWCARVEKNESRIFPKQSGAHTFITMGTCTLYAQLLPMHASIHKANGNFGRVKKHLAFLYWIESNRICDRSNEIKLNLKFWSVVCLLTHLAHRIYVSNSCNAIISTLTSNNILQPFIEFIPHTSAYSQIWINLNGAWFMEIDYRICNTHDYLNQLFFYYTLLKSIFTNRW